MTWRRGMSMIESHCELLTKRMHPNFVMPKFTIKKLQQTKNWRMNPRTNIRSTTQQKKVLRSILSSTLTNVDSDNGPKIKRKRSSKITSLKTMSLFVLRSSKTYKKLQLVRSTPILSILFHQI